MMNNLIANRRGFLGGLLALVSAPAIVRADNIMPVRPLVLPPPPTILRPDDYVWTDAVLESVSQVVRPVDHPTGLRALLTNKQIVEKLSVTARCLAWDSSDACLQGYGRVYQNQA